MIQGPTHICDHSIFYKVTCEKCPYSCNFKAFEFLQDNYNGFSVILCISCLNHLI